MTVMDKGLMRVLKVIWELIGLTELTIQMVMEMEFISTLHGIRREQMEIQRDVQYVHIMEKIPHQILRLQLVLDALIVHIHGILEPSTGI